MPADPAAVPVFTRVPRGLRLFGGWGALVALALNSALFDGFFGDAAGYLGSATRYYYDHPFAPFIADAGILDSGHPLLLCRATAFLWRLVGIHSWCAHALVWLCAAAGLALTHEAARRLLASARPGPLAGFLPAVAALLMLAHPHFIGQAAQYHTSIPSLAFTLGYVLAAALGRPAPMLGWGLLLVSNRITDILTVGACLLFDLLAPCPNDQRARRRLCLWLQSSLVLVFLGHFALKSLAGLPVTNSIPNTGVGLDPVSIARSFGTIFTALFTAPRLALFPLFAAGAVPLLAALRTELRRGDSGAGLRGRWLGLLERHPFTARFYGLGLAVSLATVAFYSVMNLNENPRFYLHLYPFLILAGFHGVARALRFRPAPVLALAFIWIVLQVIRWQPSRLKPLEEKLPPIFSLLFDARLETSLEARRHIALVHAMARDLKDIGGSIVLVGNPPSARMLSQPHLGYVDAPRPAHEALPAETPADFAKLVNDIRAANPGATILAPVAVWDGAAWRVKFNILSQPGVKLLITHKLDGASILLLYHLRG